MNPNLTLKILIKSQGKNAKEEERNKDLQTTRKRVTSGNNYIPTNNYFKCKWPKCSNQKDPE